MNKINLPVEVITIIDNLYANNHEAFAVGGCIRDSIMGRIPADWDITTSATPKEVQVIFERLGYKIIETGIKHGTVTLLFNKQAFEITTYRIDGDYLDNRRPNEVFFTKDLKSDLQRRDFTINAMAYNHIVGLKDYYNGIEHLKMRRIATVGKSEDRFREDALRMLRAIRFSSTLNFIMDKEVEDSIINNHTLLKNVSFERIRDELNKILLSDIPSSGIIKLCDLNLMKYIIPQLLLLREFQQESKYYHKDIFNHTMVVLDNVEQTLIQRLSALFHEIGKPESFTKDKKGVEHFKDYSVYGEKITKEVLKILKFDNTTISKVSLLVREHLISMNLDSKEDLKKFIIRVGEENLKDIFKLAVADKLAEPEYYPTDGNLLEIESRCFEILNNREPLYIKDLLISGNDLINIGLPKGKFIGNTLNYLLSQVLINPDLNKKEILTELAKKYCKL
jgi:tRNA nucleotidyltransferase (CCA-adding enzyme)